MAKPRAIVAILLMSLPIAAPAFLPRTLQTSWAASDPIRYQIRSGDTLERIAARGLNDPADAELLAAANNLGPRASLRAGDRITVPAMLVRRDPMAVRVLSFVGEAKLGSGSPLEPGMMLVEGDEVITGPDAHVRLSLEGDRRLMLPSRSHLRIEALHRIPLTGVVNERLVLVDGDDGWLARLEGSRAPRLLTTPAIPGRARAAAGAQLAQADGLDGKVPVSRTVSDVGPENE